MVDDGRERERARSLPGARSVDRSVEPAASTDPIGPSNRWITYHLVHHHHHLAASRLHLQHPANSLLSFGDDAGNVAPTAVLVDPSRLAITHLSVPPPPPPRLRPCFRSHSFPPPFLFKATKYCKRCPASLHQHARACRV